jgi:hypothetical protein
MSLCAASDDRPSRRRSAVTNGTRLHVRPPGDTAWARRFADLLSQITADISPDGAGSLTEAQRQLARRAALLCIECERLESKSVSGEAIDLDSYGALTDRIGRAFQRLGLKRVARSVTPTLADLLREDREAQARGEDSDEA